LHPITDSRWIQSGIWNWELGIILIPCNFVPSLIPDDSQTSDAWWFIFSGYRLLVCLSDRKASIPIAVKPEDIGVDAIRTLYLGSLRGRPCYVAEGAIHDEISSKAVFQELRSLFDSLEDGFFNVALAAVHLIEWDKRYRFCSRCRGELKPRTDVRAKECAACGLLEFPRLSPAIIVLIEKGDTLLLAHSARFPGDWFSVLAGFVEPGESLEEAVHREVKEETGIIVKNISYFGSQPWPFPDSLMIGFTAEYESGEILIDGEEIDKAGWFKADALPKVPGKLSIARELIDWFVKKHS
jgi:NAD+ diphosphatase